jgi:hypothetical protein
MGKDYLIILILFCQNDFIFISFVLRSQVLVHSQQRVMILVAMMMTKKMMVQRRRQQLWQRHLSWHA